MEKIKKILFAYNGRDGSKRALKKALSLASYLKAEVYVITVESVPEYSETMDEIQEEKEMQDRAYSAINEEGLKAFKEAGVKVHSVIAYGKTDKEIVMKGKELEADLIVLGRSKHHPLVKKFCHILGSVTGLVLENAHCSVLVVR